jgi:hypothetical protein
MEQDTQAFRLWTLNGEVDLGEVVIEGREQWQVWQEIRINNTRLGLGEFDDFQMDVGQNPMRWSDVPCADMTLIPMTIIFADRGSHFRFVDRNATLKPHFGGPADTC